MNQKLAARIAAAAAVLLLCLGGIDGTLRAEDELHVLRYNHPGLVVDLGVGLWAWPVPCDADGDGDFDLIVSCPDKPSNGVWLFENTEGDTKENKFPVFKPAKKLSGTTHYVMPSYVDGTMRVLTPGYEYRNFTKTGISEREKLPIDARFYKPQGKQPKGPKVRHNQWRYADVDGDAALDLVVGIEDWSYYGWDDAWNAAGQWTNGPLHGFVLWFRNKGTTESPEYAEPISLEADGKPIDVYGCPSPNFADFDGDGDLDLLCGEFIDGFTYFQNVGTRPQDGGLPTGVLPQYAAPQRVRLPNGERLVMDLQMIVPVAFDWDRDGDHDLIVGDEDGRVALIENTGEQSNEGTPIFLEPRYFQQEADELKCGALATPVGTDWDHDGDVDIVSGNTAGYIEFFENLSGPSVEQPKWAAPVRLKAGGKTYRMMAGPNGSIQGPAEAKWGYTTLSVADWNHDGLLDIVVNGIWGRVEWLENVGTKETPQLAPPAGIQVAWPAAPPKPTWVWWMPGDGDLVTQWRTTPLATDWNGDGLTDLIMLDHEGYLAFFERRVLDGVTQLLPPQRRFMDTNLSTTDGPLRLNRKSAGASGRRKLWIVDWDGDGLQDFLANSTSANLLRQTKQEDGRWYFEDRGPLVSQNIQGHTTSPTTVDFNGDGTPDFLGGAENGRFYYMRNRRPN
jgi:hypothetical protein